MGKTGLHPNDNYKQIYKFYMKVLFIYSREFSYNPTEKTVDFADEVKENGQFKEIQTAFVQVEEKDEEEETKVAKKLLKNLKWVANKNQTKKILLHSFAHLSESKASPEFTQEFLNNLENRLSNSGYEVSQTPFGYFLDLNINAPGFSLARVFKSL